MAPEDPPTGAAATSGGNAPPNVAHAVVRSAVLDRLDARWDHPVTTVVAGAGFGKSVAIGQALRANRARPRGVEAWLTCRAGCETPGRFASAVEAAFGRPGPGPGSPSDRLYAAFADQAPLHVSLVLDDVELLADEAATVLDGLVRRAPANLHLVLCGRRLPPQVGLARFRAADELVELGPEDLRFDEAEVVALCDSLGADPPPADLAGWPALVRLALVAPRRSVDDYVWEEVVRGLGDDDRRALLALCLLGPSTPADVESVTGVPLDADEFAERVPLVHRVGDQLVAHDLWTPYLDQLAAGGDLAALTAGALRAVADRGDPVATGSVALRLGAHDALATAAVELVRSTLGSLPVAIAEDWAKALHAAPGDVAGTPPVELLDCALENARAASAPTAERLGRLASAFRERGDGWGEAVALALGTVAAEARDDVGHLLAIAGRARDLAEGQDEPRLQLLQASAEAVVAALGGGDLDTALATFAAPVGGVPPSERPEAMVRLHWHFLLLAGRAAEAAALTETVGATPGLSVRRELHGVARFLDGDPERLVGAAGDLDPERYELLSERDRFDNAAFAATLGSAGADRGVVDRALAVLAASPFATGAGPDGALTAVARACGAILDGDDPAAEAIIGGFVEGVGADEGLDPLTDAHLRRWLAVPYVCSPVLRERWDRAALGPSHVRLRAVARLLVDARAGTVATSPPAPLDGIWSALPLPWSLELACRAAPHARWGVDLAVHLVDVFGPPVLEAVRALTERTDPVVRIGAEAVLAAMPVRPPAAVAIRVLGPLEVVRDDAATDAPELHRTRVRELLCLLVLERTVSRDRAVDLLWPDLDLAKGRANLRVTLRHLQKLLEPERPQGAAPYFVRGDLNQLQLADVAGLEVDVWQAESALAQAERAWRAGHAAARIEHLHAAVAGWRGRPVPDLDRVDEVAHVGQQLGSRLVEAALDLGELELVSGATDSAASAASALAERALAADPYLERAHRLAVAARLQARDRSATLAAVARLRAALEDLGVPPDPTTQILLRNASQWLGPVDLTAERVTT